MQIYQSKVTCSFGNQILSDTWKHNLTITSLWNKIIIFNILSLFLFLLEKYESWNSPNEFIAHQVDGKKVAVSGTRTNFGNWSWKFNGLYFYIFSRGSDLTTTNVCQFVRPFVRPSTNCKIIFKSFIPLDYHWIINRIDYRID